jgi:hypothetical protein
LLFSAGCLEDKGRRNNLAETAPLIAAFAQLEFDGFGLGLYRQLKLSKTSFKKKKNDNDSCNKDHR